MNLKKASRSNLSWEDRNPTVYDKSLSKAIKRAKQQLEIAKKEKKMQF